MQQDEKGFLNVLEMFHWVLTPVVTSGFLLTTRFLSFLFTYLFIYWLHWVFVAVHGLSLVAASGGYSSLQCAGFSLRWLLLLWRTGSRRADFSSCDTQAQ